MVTASVSAVEKSTKEAVAKTSERLRAMAKDLKDMGIAEERIEFLQPFVERDTESVRQKNGEYKQVTLGFKAVQRIRVRVNALDKFGAVVTTLTNRDAQMSDGISYKARDPGKLQARARALAIADARRKARDYAAGSKRRLGKLLVVEES